MDTKRCVNCHKLLRADTQVCSRCGYTFTITKKPRLISKDVTRPSIPPASPHRAGHYSGLHPEDQPYQSSMMAVPSVARGGTYSSIHKLEQQTGVVQELEEVSAPLVGPFSTAQEDPEDQITLPSLSRRQISGPDQAAGPVAPGITRRQTPRQLTPQPVQSSRPPAQPASPTPPLSYPAYYYNMQIAQPLLSGRVIPILLAASCLFLLVASSIIAFVLTGKHSSVATMDQTARVTASPNILRTNDVFTLAGTGFGAHSLIAFICDVDKTVVDKSSMPIEAHADKAGSFAVKAVVPPSWAPGQHTIHTTDETQRLSIPTSIMIQQPPASPPHLQLSTNALDYAANRVGTIENKILTLINSGGGQITWQASSDASWLSTSPGSDTFSGREDVNVTVNRATLAPQAYTGHITFESKSGAPLLKLVVTTKVNPDPGSLSVSQAALTYSASTNQNPPEQTLVLQNNGGQAVDWTSSATTYDGASWLSITPSSGHLNAKGSATVTVSTRTQQLALGAYTGIISFNGNTRLQVSVTLNVVAPGSLAVTPLALTFNTTTGHTAARQTVTLQNTSGQTLAWSANATGGNWLSVIPANGSLAAGSQATLTVVADGTALAAGAYQGTVNIISNGTTNPVPVNFTLTSQPTPAISLPATVLNFTTYRGTNPVPKTFSVTDSGNSALNWSVQEDGNGASFAPVTPTQGSLAPGRSAVLTISPNVTSYTTAQQLSTTITISDIDTGVTAAPQKINVNIIILDQPQVSISASNLTFNNSSVYPYTSQPFSLSNTGSGSLNWAVTAQPTGSTTSTDWLTVDVTSGTLAAGKQVPLSVRCDSSQLKPGRYTATLTFKDSDVGTQVQPQSVNVTLVVSS